MKQNVGNRVLAALLSLVLLAGLTPATAFAAETDTGRAIQLGTSGISGWNSADGYDYLYFGNWEAPDEYTTTGPLKWRVLDDQTSTGEAGLFLLSDTLLGSGKYGRVFFQESCHEYGDDDVYHQGSEPSDGNHAQSRLANAWQGSDAQSWCNGFFATSLTQQEQNAVLATTKSDDAFTSNASNTSYDNTSYTASENILSGNKVFFLSAEEAENEAYGFTDNDARIADYGSGTSMWWLRSPLANYTYVSGAITFGGGVGSWPTTDGWAARPAFNLDLDSILFTSAALGGKADATVDGNLVATGTADNNWKLTLIDASRSAFAADADGQTSISATAGSTVQINYAGAQTGSNEYVSVLLCDADSKALYYGTIAQNSASGTASVTIPSRLADGDYTLKVFNEQCNGNYQTDYASDFADIALTVMPDTAAYTLTVNLNGGNGSTTGGEYAKNTVVPIDAGTKDGYRFTGWSYSNAGAFGDILSPSTTFTMPAGDTTLTANWQSTGSTGKAIRTDTSHIEGGQASSVYFGHYLQSSDGNGSFNSDPIKWRVLSNADGRLFLLSDQNLSAQAYYPLYTDITWEESTIRSWLNGYGASENGYGTDYRTDNFIDTAFSSGEQSAIAETHVYNATQSDRVSPSNPRYGIPGGNDTTDKLFLLSIEEASNNAYFPNGASSGIAFNTDYTLSLGNMYEGGEFWWLRSPGEHLHYAASVGNAGNVLYFGFDVNDSDFAVRPAFNVDLSSVLFTSAAEGGKADAAVDGDLTAVGDGEWEWKLTLLDASRNFSANVNGQASASATAGNSVQINYSGAQAGASEYVSVLLCDADGNALYYGTIAQGSASGTASVTIPSDLAAGSYTLKVFSEQCNGDYQTDYASAFEEIELKVTDSPQAPTDPTDQDEPEKSDNTSGNTTTPDDTTGQTIPQTGDSNNPVAWIALLLVAASALAAAAYSRTRGKR